MEAEVVGAVENAGLGGYHDSVVDDTVAFSGLGPVETVGGQRARQDAVEAAGLPSPVGEPRALYSPGVDVEVEWLERMPKEEIR